MDFEKGKAVEGFPFGMIDKYGDPITTGTVSGYVTKDGGTQEPLSMTPTHEGNGQWSVNISAAEMNADTVGLLFTHPSGVPQHFTLRTVVPVSTSLVPSTATGVITDGDLTWTYYGTLSRADLYFGKRLNIGPWDRAISDEREAALIMATRVIDRLNFAGNKNDSSQTLQFPRGDDTEVPVDIEYATYEVALAFLDGRDLDVEVETLGILSDSHSGVRSTYNADHYNEHLRAGIPSIDAWEYLRPYLRDPMQVRLSRVS